MASTVSIRHRSNVYIESNGCSELLISHNKNHEHLHLQSQSQFQFSETFIVPLYFCFFFILIHEKISVGDGAWVWASYTPCEFGFFDIIIRVFMSLTKTAMFLWCVFDASTEETREQSPLFCSRRTHIRLNFFVCILQNYKLRLQITQSSHLFTLFTSEAS